MDKKTQSLERGNNEGYKEFLWEEKLSFREKKTDSKTPRKTTRSRQDLLCIDGKNKVSTEKRENVVSFIEEIPRYIVREIEENGRGIGFRISSPLSEKQIFEREQQTKITSLFQKLLSPGRIEQKNVMGKQSSFFRKFRNFRNGKCKNYISNKYIWDTNIDSLSRASKSEKEKEKEKEITEREKRRLEEETREIERRERKRRREERRKEIRELERRREERRKRREERRKEIRELERRREERRKRREERRKEIRELEREIRELEERRGRRRNQEIYSEFFEKMGKKN